MSTSALAVPEILSIDTKSQPFPLDASETAAMIKGRKLYESGFHDHALLELWNAAVHNLRRRVEAYGVDLFASVVKDESGRKKYQPDGETIQERWFGVDDFVLIQGATRLGLLSKKAGKVVETINWMRSHASAAHGADEEVTAEDVISFALSLQKNLFEQQLPDPGHSVGALFEPVKTTALGTEQLGMLVGQVKSLKPGDLRTCFGFLMDVFCKGTEPALSNARALLPTTWERAGEDLRKIAGVRYQGYELTPASDDSLDKGARQRLLEFLVSVQGVHYIPDGVRAVLYRRAATKLALAKNTTYGWSDEDVAAQNLAQLGTLVPSIAFDEVYQEILAVWCGNHWGRSNAHMHLAPFIDGLNTERLLQVVRLFTSNARVQSELSSAKPKARALTLLNDLKARFTFATHLAEVDGTIQKVSAL